MVERNVSEFGYMQDGVIGVGKVYGVYGKGIFRIEESRELMICCVCFLVCVFVQIFLKSVFGCFVGSFIDIFCRESTGYFVGFVLGVMQVVKSLE